VLVAVTYIHTYFLNPNDIEFISDKVSSPSLSIFITSFYISQAFDLIIYEHHLSAIKNVYLIFPTGISLLLSTDSLVSTPLPVHDFADGLRELSLKQVSYIRISLNRQLDLVFVLDLSDVTVSRICALVVP